ncbi:MAG: hypothetical protein QM523_01255 [Candidatus Pacebacteria bacterium]|nr:hypothetical protein [Candidatus Paceibacterota bacterium]
MTARSPKKPFLRETITVTIDKLGGSGDGIATITTAENQFPRRIFIPYCLPTETVIAETFERSSEGLRANLIEITNSAPNRTKPHCQHFGHCGGCALQHISPTEQAKFKTEKIITGLTNRGWDAKSIPILPIQSSAAGQRRRAVFTAKRAYADQGGELSIGFNQKSAHRIIDLQECPVLLPQLFALLELLRLVLQSCLNPGVSADILTTATDSGTEMVIRAHDRLKGGHKKPLPLLTPAALDSLLQLAHQQKLSRLIWQSAGHRPETLHEGQKPTVRHGGFAVPFPTGGFLQATQSGEELIVAAVLAGLTHLPPPAKILDLYAGSGTLTLPLVAAGYSLHAVEGDPTATAALMATRADYSDLKNSLKITRRDLVKQPLLSIEFADYDAVILDPPRVGAEAQVTEIAKSSLQNLIYVSCGPESFAKDASILAAAGFRLSQIQPIDQFVWSPHVELVAYFSR